MDKDEILQWLTKIGKTRSWLAEQIGCTKGTLDQWFSKGFPEWATKSIDRLVNTPQGNTNGLEVSFSAKEFELIEHARKLSGHATRAEFYRDAIMEFTDELIEKEKQSPPTVIKGPFPPTSYSFPSDTDGLKVAER